MLCMLMELDRETDELVNCAVAYRKLGKGEPLYWSKKECINQWIRIGAHQAQAEYHDLFNRLEYELATDMTPLNRKVLE